MTHAFRIRRLIPTMLAVGCVWSTGPARGDEDVPHALLKAYCIRCHNPEKHKGDVDLTTFGARPSTLAGRKVWLRVLDQLQTEEMPPEDPAPTEDERRRLIAWAEGGVKLDWTKIRNPGRVTIPRLTREEYGNTLRDLLGIDVQPGSELTPDGEGTSGFNTDRDALYLTPALLEKYLSAASAALDACLALEHPPVQKHFESEELLMTETREVPRDFGDGFKGYVLNRGQMTLYTSVRFPHDGFYTFTVRARSTGAACGGRLRIDGETRGDILASSSTPETLTVTCFVKAGSRQMTWNIETPDLPAPRPAAGVAVARGPGAQAKAARAQQKAQQKKQQQNQGGTPRSARPLPGNVNELITMRSQENAPEYPVTGKEPEGAQRLIMQLNGFGVSVQRPYEWLRVLAEFEGDRQDIARFKGYTVERGQVLDALKTALAQALGEPRADFDRRYDEHNRDRLAANRQVLELGPIAAVPFPTGGPTVSVQQQLAQFLNQNQNQNQQNRNLPNRAIAIDWIELSGPIHPEGAGRRSRVLVARPDEAAGVSGRDAARAILASFLPRAFRRPVGDDQVARYLAFFDRAVQNGDDFEAAVKLALTAVLVSPNFLYRNEFGPVDGEYRLDDYQVASRLSYFLWMSMPDDPLFALAAQGRLHEPEVLSAQVDRMLADPKARAFTSAFMGQWLGVDSLGRSLLPDESRFPEFTPELREAMKQEPVLAFESLLRRNGSLLGLLDARETWLNEPLARHYGIEGVQGKPMRPVALNDPNRGGLLGMAGILTVTSGPTRTSPVVRGKWVLETLLGEKVPEPPADAGTLDAEAGEGRGKTLREELALHRRNASCASCHSKIDPIGFGLENFDAIGHFRTQEAGRPVDNTGELPDGTTFRGLPELKQVLVNKRHTQFVRNLAERLLSFALGRKLELYDEPALMTITAALEADGLRGATLVKQIVLSDPFQYQSNKDTL
jgi:hypothetical protein